MPQHVFCEYFCVTDSMPLGLSEHIRSNPAPFTLFYMRVARAIHAIDAEKHIHYKEICVKKKCFPHIKRPPRLS